MKPSSRFILLFSFFSFAFLLFISLFSSASPKAQLHWGGDSEGGAPFVFQDPADPEKLIGFEKDLADALAEEMNRTAVFVQNQWDGLVPGLKRGNYDVILNGLEITPDREKEISFSAPYYATAEQISVRKGDKRIASLDDCVGKKVGTLKSSLAERILSDKGGIAVVTYDDDTHPYSDLALGRLDAVLMDFPIALYRESAFPELEFAGSPVGELHYGIGVRRNDPALLAEVNAALSRLRETGKLRAILDSWGLWNSAMTGLTDDHSTGRTPPEKYRRFLQDIGKERDWRETAAQYAGFLPLLFKGAAATLEISLLSMALAVTAGLLLALTRLYALSPLRKLSVAFIELVRGTPLLIQLFLIFYGLPNLGIKLSPLIAAILGLGFNYAAYEAENYRAGILSIPKNQHDAAAALGMTRMQSLRHVILPQALRLVIPPVTNDFISLLKDSSLVSVITMVELTKVYGQLAAVSFDYLGIGILTAAVYFLIGLPFVRLSRYAESKFAKST